ncbi:toll-like receptor 2 type-2 isoform X2 [Anguilla anguilla]|uniref:toll-like receptor 2 type-2 isoform X2 n=1 Tax=Anguilla anguilla TaxID=7936 RepID=UPI0015A7F668|nr:toll-like receptor 2 type-2 isoform X2 [Anguilla anguilla]XP_035282218.1 toll-like receptor 2 type-2 isoform X2 [Anguilla anguilla]
MGTLIFALLFGCLLTRQSTQLERQNCQRCDKQFFCDCSDESLPQVPKVPEDTLGFNLSFNHIEKITNNDFHDYNHLKTLYLQSNWIADIHESAFSSLGNLERLDLSYNRLTSLSSSWFDWLISLQHLNLLGNTYQTLGTGFLFARLGRMRSLLFGNPSFYSMGKNDLVGLRDLDEMVLSGNNLVHYEDGSLSKIRLNGSLTLCLDHLFQKDLGLLTIILRDICSPETFLIIADVMLNNNPTIQPFVQAMKKGVTKILLKNVTATDEAIIHFLQAMDNAPLMFFGVEDSLLLGRGFWDKVNATRHDKLETLYIKNLAIQDFYAFSSLTYLANILKYPKNISVINSEVFLMPCPTSKLLKKLEYLDFTGNLLTDLAMRESMCGGRGTLLKLRFLNVSKNSLKSLALMNQLVSNLNKLESLDLSQNLFSVMPEECTWPTSLQYLNLSLTQLGKITECLPKSLHVLDLNGNHLTVFDIELPYLKELYISGNKFTSLPSGRWFPRLELLLIQQNVLNMFDANDLKEYKNLRNLEAGYNKFVCSCEFLAFMQQKVSQLVKIGDGPESYVCDSPVTLRGQLVADAHLSIFECHMMVAVSGLCTIVFLAMLICGILCYKLHVVWYVKMTWAWLQAKRKPKVNANNDICYDAFVSYSERDSEWLEEFLVPELEGAHPPFRLCLHKRDFLPGQWIVDNIINAMEKSHTTLFVLSRHFVSSEWCKYELDFSHFRLFDENNDTAVLILLEPIAKETIPKRFCKLRKFMNSRTYLEWPEDEEQRPLFWHNLKVAIKRGD